MTTRTLSLVACAGPEEDALGLGEREDDDLMLLARRGNAAAFDTIVRRHRNRVLRLAYRYVNESELAADIAQNTFVALLHAVPLYRARGKFRSYLYSMLLNQCRMVRRAGRIEARARDRVVAPPSSADSTVLPGEQRRDLELALGALSSTLREAVLLRFGAELSYQEIAETLSIPVGTAKSRVFVGLAKLREALEGP